MLAEVNYKIGEALEFLVSLVQSKLFVFRAFLRAYFRAQLHHTRSRFLGMRRSFCLVCFLSLLFFFH